MTAPLVFNIPQFRIDYPAFASEEKYPDTMLQAYWDAATCFISNKNYGWLNGCCREQALDLMTAHITQLGTNTAAGKSSGVTVSATVGSVSVSVMPPPAKNAFKYWLYMTPYGAQLAALLAVKAVGGLSVGGLPEKTGFRKIGGVFW